MIDLIDKELPVSQNQPGGSQYRGAFSICASYIALHQLSLAKRCFDTSMQKVSYKVSCVDMFGRFAQHMSPPFRWHIQSPRICHVIHTGLFIAYKVHKVIIRSENR